MTDSWVPIFDSGMRSSGIGVQECESLKNIPSDCWYNKVWEPLFYAYNKELLHGVFLTI